jgi:hypothetical protein
MKKNGIMMMKLVMAAMVVAGIGTGCVGTRPLRPGAASMRSGLSTNGMPEFRSELKQPENPAQSAAQNFERTTETELPLGAGTRVTWSDAATPEKGTAERTVVLTSPTVQRTRVVEKAGTVIGAAQKDTTRELGAKLASLKGIVWVGVGLFLFGVASLAYPPLRLIIGSVTTSVAMMLGGVALMVLPSLIVGNELLIMGVVCGMVGVWFLAHRHGELRGKVGAASGDPPSRAMEGKGGLTPATVGVAAPGDRRTPAFVGKAVAQ